jgi:hypothetical protein
MKFIVGSPSVIVSTSVAKVIARFKEHINDGASAAAKPVFGGAKPDLTPQSYPN